MVLAHRTIYRRIAALVLLAAFMLAVVTGCLWGPRPTSTSSTFSTPSRLVANFSGSSIGNSETAHFITNGDWNLSWGCDPTSYSGPANNMQVPFWLTISVENYGPSPMVTPVNTTCKNFSSGVGDVDVHQSGEQWLVVLVGSPGGNWYVQVTVPQSDTGAKLMAPTPHFAPTPISGLLAPPPTDCHAEAAPQRMTLSAQFGGGFVGDDVVTGTPPAWQLGLGDGTAPLDLEANGPTPYPSTKVLWIVGPNYGEPVTLQGYDLRTSTPMWLLLAGNGNENPADATSSVVLAPAYPNRGTTDNSAGHWTIYGVLIYFTVAGCYELDVSWPEGYWRTVFAAGR